MCMLVLLSEIQAHKLSIYLVYNGMLLYVFILAGFSIC